MVGRPRVGKYQVMEKLNALNSVYFYSIYRIYKCGWGMDNRAIKLQWGAKDIIVHKEYPTRTDYFR